MPLEPLDPNVDQTYCLRHGEHYCIVDGRTFGPWPDHGAAVAGMQVEQRRAEARKAKEGREP